MTELDPAAKILRRSEVTKPSGQVRGGFPKTKTEPIVVEDKVTLSGNSPVKPASKPVKTGVSGEIRKDLVNKFRSFLENGTYEVKAEEIADKMVQKIREQKNRIII